MRILGVDPGLAVLGWGVVDVHPVAGQLFAKGWGTAKTTKSSSEYDRLVEIGQDVTALLVEHRPDVCVVERFQVRQATGQAMWVHRAVGVLVFVARLHGCVVVEYAPMQMKATVTGSGKAEKVDVQMAVQTALALSCLPTPDHAADALGLALCHVKRERMGGVA